MGALAISALLGFGTVGCVSSAQTGTLGSQQAALGQFFEHPNLHIEGAKGEGVDVQSAVKNVISPWIAENGAIDINRYPAPINDALKLASQSATSVFSARYGIRGGQVFWPQKNFVVKVSVEGKPQQLAATMFEDKSPLGAISRIFGSPRQVIVVVNPDTQKSVAMMVGTKWVDQKDLPN